VERPICRVKAANYGLYGQNRWTFAMETRAIRTHWGVSRLEGSDELKKFPERPEYWTAFDILHDLDADQVRRVGELNAALRQNRRLVERAKDLYENRHRSRYDEDPPQRYRDDHYEDVEVKDREWLTREAMDWLDDVDQYREAAADKFRLLLNECATRYTAYEKIVRPLFDLPQLFIAV
jgi:hypothetical protein